MTSPDLHDILPNYEVLDLIGRGGMGIVYKARQLSLNRNVAIKLLPREIIRDDIDFRERFKQEALTMARLSHPGIVGVHDFGETVDGQLFFVMEFVDGTDLAKIIGARGPLPVDEALRVFQRVAEALVYAHGEGVIHRDIKPANVLIKSNGEVKVADFGLAKMVTPGTVGLTATSTSMGSHDFAAPEVFVHGGDADHRADIYSLGVMLYQMLTGVIPRGMFKLPSERVPGLDVRFDEAICKSLEQDREDRFQSVREMMKALEFAFFHKNDSSDVTVDKARAGRTYTWWHWVGFLAVISILVGAVWIASNRSGASSSKMIPNEDEWVDVFAQIDLSQHRRAGRWKKVEGAFENTDSTAGGVLELPVKIRPGASDLRFRLTRLAVGSGRVSFAFIIGDRAGQFSIGDYGRPSAGLEYIDGKSISDNGAHVEHVAAYLNLGRAHDLLLQLRDEGMAAQLDGNEIYRWKGDWARVTQGQSKVPEAMKGLNVFAIYVGNGRVRLEGLAVRSVSGDSGRMLPPPPDGGMSPKPPLPEVQIYPGNGHRYLFVPGEFIWSAADANARSVGGYLATLTSQEEHDWAWRTFSPWLPASTSNPATSRGWWIGGLQSSEGVWQWVTGEPFVFNRLGSITPSADVRVPRLLQHDNGGDNGLSAWQARHYSRKHGYLVEWDGLPTQEDADARKLVAWVLSLPLSSEPSHEDHKVPDVMIEGSNRNLRKLTDLPVTPFALSRIRIGPLPVDEIARQHLDILARQTRLYDLRIYAAEDGEVLASMSGLVRLGTLVFKAMPGKSRTLTDEQLTALSDLVNLNSLRIEGWSGMTGSGFAAFKNKRKLSSLSLNDCTNLTDDCLTEIAKFTNLETLSLVGATNLTDTGLLQLKSLNKLKSLGLGIHTKFSEKALTELEQALPQCVVNIGG